MTQRDRHRAAVGGVLAHLLDVAPGGWWAADADDAAHARAARERYAAHGLDTIEADAAVAELLWPGERVVAAQPCVVAHRPPPGAPPAARSCVTGDLYLTTCRLLHLGPQVMDVPLDDIVDATATTGRLLLILAGGRPLAFDTPQPRLLRVLVALARSERAGVLRSEPGTSGPPPGDSPR